MALAKTATLPDYGHTVTYYRIDTIDRLCQTREEAQFRIYAYKDEATARTPGGRGYYHGGVIDVKGPVFAQYFSRAALAAASHSVHGQAYQLIKDYNAALATADADRTDAQRLLLTPGQVRIANDFGGPTFFADATDC